MDWLTMLRGAPGRLTAVRRISDADLAARKSDLAEHGDVICAACGFQGFAGGYIRHGVFAWNSVTSKFDVPAESGLVVYECPRCHFVDDAQHKGVVAEGIMHLAGWELMKGEWREHVCENQACAGRGTRFISLGCPGCGEFAFWHHATNAPPNTHGWQIEVAGGVLTMSPSLLLHDCHFFIRGNQVQWC